VVPSLDETTNILHLRDNLRTQRRNLSPNVALRVVISDNGSNADMLNIYQRVLHEESLKPPEERLDIAIVTGSEKGFNSSARSIGTREAIRSFHERNPQDQTKNHLIVSFDADSKFERDDALQILTEMFTNANMMVAYGPVKFLTSSGKISTDYELLQRPFTRALLGYLFRINGRRMRDYINPPHEIFHGIFTAIRESALVAENNPQKMVVDYNTSDRAGVDVRLSLLLQRHLQESQVSFDSRLAVLTSARGYETRNGDISRFRLFRRAANLFLSTHYVPYALKQELNTFTESQREEIANIRFASLIGSFVRDVDTEVYQLAVNEGLIGIVNSREASRRRKRGFTVIPARDLKTGALLPNKFAVIERRNE
ncbi:MAG: hypothetical protein KGJ07_08900, partial [Patescibacteria group bacterium]|nr:hypothetical protein [Patescibacteria group bacterium]